ncbi:YjdF family protein [Clostridium frigidicarnis]|uniref:DUF2992 domain-containing protein n=1 Tax=Clostridium frigidicarnis TaxID=84698 RepID=A0A1I1AWL8_9CLOT|nr:YjdF family protein [Clostridium frigidicarnis]SFB41932.1 Protein of unknown function [Clostridium frigidicarnis]
MSSIKLTVIFEEPFWIGVFESYEDYSYKVCKITFGAEPKDEEVYDFILNNFYHLNFSNEIKVDSKDISVKRENPKRLQRRIKKETKVKGIGTKAQIALKEQYEENKISNKKRTKEEKREVEQRKFELKQRKKHEKHKGH